MDIMTKGADSLNNPLLTEDIGVFFLNMDTAVEEEVHPNEDGSYSIFINSHLNWERQMAAYQHALEHIINDDFGKESADKIEKSRLTNN